MVHMAKKKRIQISLTPESYAVIERHAYLQSVPKSAVVSELIEAVTPALAATVAILEAAAHAPENVRNDLKGSIESMEKDMLEKLHGINGNLGWIQGKFEDKP